MELTSILFLLHNNYWQNGNILWNRDIYSSSTILIRSNDNKRKLLFKMFNQKKSTHKSSCSYLIVLLGVIFFYLKNLGEGNGTLLQYSCLENPMDGEPGRLQSMGLLRVGLDWVTSLSLFTFMHWRRKWQPTPVFLPRESQGWGSLVGCRLWGCTESDTTEAT